MSSPRPTTPPTDGGCIHNAELGFEYPCPRCVVLTPEQAELEAHHRSVQLSPAATPTRTRKIGPLGPKVNNSWERGLAVDGRGMPLLTTDGRHVTVKEYGERRHEIEAARRHNAQAPAPPHS